MKTSLDELLTWRDGDDSTRVKFSTRSYIDLQNIMNNLCLDGPLPSVLQEVTVPVIRNDICESMYRNAGYIEHIPHIFICAGHKQGSIFNSF